VGYHVTILRSNADGEIPISRDEVVKLVESRPDLSIWKDAPDSLEIVGKTKLDFESFLIWQDGYIWTKNPDRDVVYQMVEMAEALNARVRGDSLETYKTAEESYIHPDDEHLLQKSKAIPSRNTRRSRALSVLIFAVIAIIYILVTNR
jgi:predicted nucleic acid-binding Zn ribbon protein